MATDYISDFNIVDSGDPKKPLTFESFRYRDDVDAWLARRSDDLALAVGEGIIDGVEVKERRTPARFIVTVPGCKPYLGFGARVVAAIGDTLVVGVPVEHTDYLLGRLGSGLIGRSRPFDTLEEAVKQAASEVK